MAITSIISNANKVPGIYLRISLGVGPRASGDSARYVVLFGNKTSSGSASVETEYDIFSEDDARTYFGAGSELFMMSKAAIAANPSVALKAIAVTESAGAYATATLTIANAATSAGTVGVSILGNEIQVPFASGDSANTVAAAVNTYINNQTDWPVTSAVVGAVVTATAKQRGPRGNHISIRGRIIEGTGTTITASAAYLGSGATSDDPQNCLDIQTALRRHYLVAPYNDATQLAKFKTHLDAQDEPESGNRKWAIFGSYDTVANTTTLCTGLNFPRMQCAWKENSDDTPAMMAAALAAFRAGAESSDPSHNYNGEAIPGLKPHYASSDHPSNTELQSALNNGITPLVSTNAGDVVIVRSVTCKSQDTSGKPDYRVLDTIKVTVPDAIADELEDAIADEFAGTNASDDPPDGVAPAPNVTTPSMVKDLIYDRLIARERNDGWLESGSVDANLDGLKVELSKTAKGRFNFVCPLDVVEWFNQAAGDIRQIG